MTITEAIELVDTFKPNQYDNDTKVAWLSKLDGIIFHDVIKTHVCGTEEFNGYTAADDTKLLVPFPYDEDVYVYFLQAQIDKENSEYAKYNQNITLFNGAVRMFTDNYNRNNKPLPETSAFLF